ncbi:ribbon-helix-helix domain-containing protein [Azospirillum cavernae]|uniref:ribbon-helix-helix domain-containing protein n=1 Tax=Azospirillum cavernae TaxID=2320860 RepID=UPI001314B031|nr:ribbon-helix-helix domain-containing protein [Azospirillum cavernae]
MICRNLKINGRRTSLRMEQDMWDALNHVAALQGVAPAALVSEVDLQRGEASTTGALRVYLLRYYREALCRVMEMEEVRDEFPRLAPAPDYVTVQ